MDGQRGIIMSDLNEDTQYLEVLEKLKEAHALFPELRLGAILQGAIDMKKRTTNTNLNNISTKEFLLSLDTFIEAHKKKRGLD